MTVHIELDEQQRKDISKHYAQKCVCLYYIVSKIAGYEKKNLQSISFNDFTLAALSHMQNGLQLCNEKLGYKITLISPDTMLMMRNVDRMFKLSETILPDFLRGKKLAQAEKVKGKIQETLHEAVFTDRQSPEMLRIDSIQFENIPANMLG